MSMTTIVASTPPPKRVTPIFDDFRKSACCRLFRRINRRHSAHCERACHAFPDAEGDSESVLEDPAYAEHQAGTVHRSDLRPMRTIMLIWVIAFPRFGKKRGIADANRLLPA